MPGLRSQDLATFSSAVGGSSGADQGSEDAAGPKETIRFASLLQPLDEDRKALLPNCTHCRGCNAELKDMSEGQVRFLNIRFQVRIKI